MSDRIEVFPLPEEPISRTYMYSHVGYDKWLELRSQSPFSSSLGWWLRLTVKLGRRHNFPYRPRSEGPIVDESIFYLHI